MAMYQVIALHSGNEMDCIAYPRKVSTDKVMRDFFDKWHLSGTNAQTTSFKVIPL